jgi:uncharacterized membrane protein YkoI
MQTAHIKTTLLLGLIVTSLTLPGSLVYADALQQKGTINTNNVDEKAYPNLAKVTLQEAVSAAVKQVPGKATDAELESEGGYLVYEVKIVSPDKKVTEVFVDAGNLEILGKQDESKDFS